MRRIGIVSNGLSWKNRDEARPAIPEGVLAEAPNSAAGYPDVLRRFADAGVDVVVVDGGDGTLRDVLAAAIAAYGEDRLPDFALMPSGKTNVAAADVGGIGRGPDALTRLQRALDDGAAERGVATRRPIAITFDGRTIYGFVFGLGAFERATGLVGERVHSAGFAQRMGVALGVVASVAAAFGSDRDVWRRGERVTLSLDGGEARERDSFAMLATSLQRWMLGLWPFWGHGTAPIALTEVDAPPRRLALGLATAGFGKPRPWAEAEGWRSARVESAWLRLHASFIVDGDRFSPGADGQVELKAGPEIRFIGL